MLAPTDAALGLPVVTNRQLPSRIRQGLNVESGLNDGVRPPADHLPHHCPGRGGPRPRRTFKVIAEEIGWGAVGGVAVGALGAWVLRKFGGRRWMEGTWRQINSNAVTFLLFGAVLLGPALGELDWRMAACALASLTVVRMLPVALAMAGTGMRRATVAFLGWFGPRGLASIVFLLILLEETELPERP
jgi:NhaP-type Na+/H+ or K+/H+ antiporter